jgi:hypothetical protein
LSWAAIAGPDPVNRQTAALALSLLPGGTVVSVSRLESALDTLRNPGLRSRRRSEMFGALAEAGLNLEEIRRRPFPQRLGVYFWRAWRRTVLNRRRIAWMALGAGIGGGLALGLERLLVGALSQSPVGVIYFALFSYWGLILAGLTGLAMALAGPLTLKEESSFLPPIQSGVGSFLSPLQRGEGGIPSASPSSPRRIGGNLLPEILLGALGFGLANFLVAVLNGIRLERAPLAVPLGFIVGLGLSAAFAGAPRGWQGWVLRGLGSAAAFALVQAFFLLIPEAGSGISIAISARSFEVEFNHFTAGWWQTWTQTFSGWASVLAFLEAALSGLALTLGGLLGRKIAAQGYLRWQDFIDRME